MFLVSKSPYSVKKQASIIVDMLYDFMHDFIHVWEIKEIAARMVKDNTDARIVLQEFPEYAKDTHGNLLNAKDILTGMVEKGLRDKGIEII